MNKKIIKKIIFYSAVTLVIFFYNSSPLIVHSYIDPVTGYNSEHVYDTIHTNGSFPNLENSDEIIQIDEVITEDTLILKDSSKEFQDIIDKGDYSIQEINVAINKINDESKLRKFFVGNKLGALSFQLVQIKNQTYVLNSLGEENEDESIKIQIDNQMKYLEKEQKVVEDFILEQKDKFSLFGWFISSL